MNRITQLFIVLFVLAFAFVGFTQTTHALTQSDVDLICIIIDCDEAGIRDALNALVDDESTEITRNLFRGISGDDVEELQELLADDPTIYPEGLVTGFYGPLTEQAVLRFQERFGIDQVGTVGPVTRATINKLLKERRSVDAVSVATTDLDNDVDDSEFGPGDTGVLLCHMPPGNPDAAHTIAVGGPAVQTHLNHGDALGACDNDDRDDDDDGDDNSDDTQEATMEEGDTVAFEFDGETYELTLNSITDEGALDENAKPDAVFSHDGEESSELEEGDEYTFESGLHVEVDGIDVDGDGGEVEVEVSLREEQDNTPLEITDISVEVGETEATVMWKTDEEADSSVFYTRPPLEIAFFIEDDELVTDHSIVLPDLIADSTYEYHVESTDAAGNTAASETLEFTTLPVDSSY